MKISNMTKIFIDENLNLNRTHFETLDEFKEYIELQNIKAEENHFVKEQTIKYGKDFDEKTYLEQLNFITEQLKQVKDFRLMERIKEIIQISKQDEPQIHQWQKDIVNKRLEDIDKGNIKFFDFNDVINEIEEEL